jgi:AcrR family transcriptional regulator
MTAVDDGSTPRTGRRRPRGTYAKTEETQAAIVEAALEVFAQGGYRSGSIRLVAERVGMSEAGLLHHFRSKSRLLEAVLEHRDQRALQFVPVDTINGEDSIRGLVELARYNASTPGIVELHCTLSAEATAPDHPAHAYFIRRYEVTRLNLTNAFLDLQRRSELRPGFSPEAASRATIAMMDGLQVQWLLDRSGFDMAEELRVFLQTLVTIDV